MFNIIAIIIAVGSFLPINNFFVIAVVYNPFIFNKL